MKLSGIEIPLACHIQDMIQDIVETSYCLADLKYLDPAADPDYDIWQIDYQSAFSYPVVRETCKPPTVRKNRSGLDSFQLRFTYVFSFFGVF
jgi:hypothetical protein